MQATMNPVYRRRLLGHRIGIALSVGAMAVGLGFLAWILFTLLVNGVGALSGGMFAPTPRRRAAKAACATPSSAPS
jgi:phosphate transport system permease protein